MSGVPIDRRRKSPALVDASTALARESVMRLHVIAPLGQGHLGHERCGPIVDSQLLARVEHITVAAYVQSRLRAAQFAWLDSGGWVAAMVHEGRVRIERDAFTAASRHVPIAVTLMCI